MAKHENQSDLIRSLISGDESAFERLIQLFEKKILGTIYSFTYDLQDTEDIAQEVFLEIHRSIRNFKGSTGLNSWIYRITVSKSIEYLRWRKADKRTGLTISLSNQSEIIEHMISDSKNAGQRMEEREKSRLIENAISHLSANQKAAFHLHYIKGLSYSEIATILQTSISGVQSLIFRAKQNLRKTLDRYYRKI